MRYSSRFFLYAPLIALLLLAAGAVVWWKIVATAFDERLDAANGREITPGVHLHFVSKTMGFDPFRLDTVLEGFTLAVQMRTGPLVWHTEHFAIHTPTYGRDQQIFEAAGTQTLSWVDSNGRRRQVAFVPGTLRASAIVAEGRLARFDLDAVAITTPSFAADRLQLHIRHAPGRDMLDFVVSGDNWHLSFGGHSELTQQISIQGALVPAIPFAALLAGHADWRNAAESWRLDSGKLVIEKIDAQQGRITTIGMGQFSLGASHQPQGRVAFDGPSPQIGNLLNGFDNSESLY